MLGGFEMINEIYCSMDPECKDPIGAVQEGTKVRFSIRLDKVSIVDSPKLIIFQIDKWDERQSIDLTLTHITQTSNFYTCYFTPSKADVYFYYFTLYINGRYVELRKGKYSKCFFGGKENECFQLTVYTKSICVPDFMKGAIFYQIFPDRFYFSGESKENVPKDRKIHSNWYENPNHLPENGLVLNDDYFGGDLKGITQKLDYIKSLGVTIIYLNPIFEAHSNHRYNTANYLLIDPLLGKEEDFVELCSQARKRGIRIILDGVFNHTGSDSIYFNKEKRYATIGAYNSPDSKYFNWYCFYDYPDGYDSWWNFDTLPKLNKNSQECLDFICQVIKKWIRLGASGFRFDVIDELTNNMVYQIAQTLKHEPTFDSQNATMIGEVWEDLSTKEAYGERKHYLTHNTLDSAMNYVYKDALFGFFESKDATNLLDNILRIIENYPKDCLDAMMNIISSHDIERALTRLAKGSANGHDRYWQAQNDFLSQEEYLRGKELLKLIATIQFFLPGNPCIYYGDEAGVYGFGDPFNRKTYPWGREDVELVEFFKKLGAIRTSEEYLKDATFLPVLFYGGICVFAREALDSTQRIYIGVNISDSSVDLSFIGAKEILNSSGNPNGMVLGPYTSIILK